MADGWVGHGNMRNRIAEIDARGLVDDIPTANQGKGNNPANGGKTAKAPESQLMDSSIEAFPLSALLVSR